MCVDINVLFYWLTFRYTFFVEIMRLKDFKQINEKLEIFRKA